MQSNLESLRRVIQTALNEDIGKGDITSNLLIPNQQIAEVVFRARENLIFCGLPVLEEMFRGMSNRALVKEGQECQKDQDLFFVRGNARLLLTLERTALNLIQRMSGVATLTRKYVDAVAHTKARILDTRKTIPGLREVDKYAVRIGGGRNHRHRLDDGVLIKDNHIGLCKNVTEAIERARNGTAILTRIEVECDTLDQVEEALQAGVDMILLDNMSTEEIARAVQLVTGKVLLEASGNMTLERVKEVAETGVDFISVGRITHSAPAVDIGLDVTFEKVPIKYKSAS
jgi:nicotinate-nucleotide pyrophosphorylase (carboxylating)